MRVVLHADASSRIGTGHVHRCLALAAALRDEGTDVALASDEMVDGLANRARELEIPLVRRAAADPDPDWAVIDGYHLDRTARDGFLGPTTKRLVIDDGGGDLSDATMAVNQNLYATPAGPTRASGRTEVLAGPAYAMLQPPYAGATPQRVQPAIADRLMVTMGGADPHDATSAIVSALHESGRGGAVRIVVGPAHPDPERVAGLARDAGYDAVVGVRSMVEELAWADLVISGCGTGILEAVRLGRPIVGVVLAENQRPVAAAVEALGLGIVAGEQPGLDVERLVSAVGELTSDGRRRSEIADRGPSLVDGDGARRVTSAMVSGPITLRPATLDDADRLLAWRSDPVTRHASFDSRAISLEEHRAWLSAQLADPSAVIRIGSLGGRPVGVVRFAVDGDRAVVSVAIGPDDRGAGIGTRLIARGCAIVMETRGVAAIDAWIRLDNSASQAAFARAGFRPVDSTDPDRLLYRLAAAPMG